MIQVQIGLGQQIHPFSLQADGVTPAKGTLSNLSFQTADPTLFTVVPFAGSPGDAMVIGVGLTTGATLTITATATEPDGSQHPVQGVFTVVTTAAPPPPPPPVASIGIQLIGGNVTPPTVPPPPPPPPPAG